MLVFSLIFISLVTLICIGKLYREKNQIKDSSIHTHVIVMALSMITSLTFGIVLGLIYMQDLVTSTIITTFIGIAIGYVVGRPFHQIASLAGMVEGVMGAMMGAMTGSMVHMAASQFLFVLFVIIVFFVICSSLFSILHGLSAKSKQIKPLDIPTKSINA